MATKDSTSDIRAIGIIGTAIIIWMMGIIGLQELGSYLTSLAMTFQSDSPIRYIFASLALSCLLAALYFRITGGLLAVGIVTYLISKIWFKRYMKFIDFIGRLFLFRWVKACLNELSVA